MSLNLAPPYILFSKGMCVNLIEALIISFIILTTASGVIMRENANALLPSDLARLNSNYKMQTLQQKVLENMSSFTSILPPRDFAYSYSFGIIGETNNTVSSDHNVYMKENEGTPPTNITFALSAAQLQRIWTYTIETHFFQIKNNFTDSCDRSGNCVLVTPEHYSILKITGNNNTHTVIAREGYVFPQNQDYQNFKNLVAEIDRMIVLTMSPRQDGANNNNTMPSIDREPERGFL